MDDAVADLVALGAATVGESGARRMAPRVAAAWPGAKLAGPAFTVRIPAGDNLAIHVAVADAPAGAVLVVEVDGGEPFGYWGEVLTTGALARGIAGLVIDGGVRDIDAIAARRFPVFAATLALTGAAKVGPGSVQRTVSVGDVTVDPGDWIVGDADGVAVVPVAALAEVRTAARARAEKERGIFAALEGGATTVTLFGLDADAIERGDGSV